MRLQSWRERTTAPLECLDQVANAPDASVDLTPASLVPLEDLREGWAPWLSGQEPPLIWERVTPDWIPEEQCRTQ